MKQVIVILFAVFLSSPVHAVVEPALPAAAETNPQAEAELLFDRFSVDEIAALAPYRPEARPLAMVRVPINVITGPPPVSATLRNPFLPKTQWDHIRGSDLWTRTAMSAISFHGPRMLTTVPRDIQAWCPAYPQNGTEMRRAFWVGMMSALAFHESTWRPEAVGGGDLWYGLLQIYPDTARRYGCRARTGEALKNPTENLSCAVRIMNVTVPRDNAIAIRDRKWRGVAADWGPMTKPSKIAQMQRWTRQQSYCQPQRRQPSKPVTTSLRPVARQG